MSSSALHIVGLGIALDVHGCAQLTTDALAAIAGADVIIGSPRQLQTIDAADTPCIELPKLSQLKALIEGDCGHCQRIVVLASGDPLYFGIGRWFSRHFEAEQLLFYPAVSSVQVACHRLGLSLQDVTVLSLHGRPLNNLRRHLNANNRLLILTDRHSTPAAIAGECRAAGFEDSTITVCENLGYRQQRLREFSVDTLLRDSQLTFDPLHVTVLAVAGAGGVQPSFPGIPDSDFRTGAGAVAGAKVGRGMISKREVRLTIASLMAPAAGDVIWDIGAGCGGVSVELSRWSPRCQVHAVEHHRQRLEHLNYNRRHFGVESNLSVHSGTAPDCLAQLAAPNKIFIGGSDGRLPALLEQCWQTLPAGGQLVASAVIDSSKQQLLAFAKSIDTEADCEFVELAVRRGRLSGGELDTVNRLPVEIFSLIKVSDSEQCL